MLPDIDEIALELRDGYRGLRLLVRGQAVPCAELDWDRDALNAVIEVETGVFRGRLRTLPWGHELANFRALLLALLDRLGQHLKASFAFIEHATEFHFELLRRGALISQVKVRPNTADVEQLVFELSVDPSQLSACVSQIDAILARFPPALTTTYSPDSDISSS